MERFQQLYRQFDDRVWQRPLDTLPSWQRTGVKAIRLAIAVARDLAAGQLTLRAMSLVFTTLLAFVPLIAVSFSVLKGFGVHNQLRPTLENFLSPLGERAGEITDNVIGFVENIEVGVLGAVGVAFLLYTAISLVQKVEEAFNFTWNVPQSRTLVRKLSDYFSVMLITPLLAFLSLGITATLASTDLVQTLIAIEPLGTLYQWGTRMVPWILVIAAFCFVYMLMPNTRVRLGPALIGAAIAGIAWESLGHLFARFVVGSANYTAVYSGFAILLLFMIWLYLSWLILLTGSSIAFYCQYPQYLVRGGRDASRLAPAQRERLALALMALIARAFERGERGPGGERLSQDLGVPLEAITATLAALRSRGLVRLTQGEPPGHVPARPPACITVKAVLDAVRQDGW
ncbi:MAG: YihY/virulence factor BrkB family protein, partial [Guyparkeria sp.]|uniref:YihY/virulence factor BrkB family protein n=1 Tax=Guyparkeria sp. TaxID=2035736 RepID=UPI00397BAF5F